MYRIKNLTHLQMSCLFLALSQTMAAADEPVATYSPPVIRVPANALMPLSPTFNSVDKHCKSRPVPKLTLIEAPHLGSVTFRIAFSRVNFGPGPWHHCNGTLERGSAVFFQAGSIPGSDVFTVRAEHYDGSVVYTPFRIEVLP